MTWWRRILFAIGLPIAYASLRLMWMTWRYRVYEDEGFAELERRHEPAVFALWHEGLLSCFWYAWRLLERGIGATFLISPSVDGDFGAQLLARFGSRAVRGSARRSGAAALRRLHRAICNDRQSPIITLDGSKGPRRYCKPGAIMVARMAGVPIVPIGFAARRAWRLPSWDRHLMPAPFTTIVIVVGEPYTVPRDMDEEALEVHRSDLEARVNASVKKAEAMVEAPTDTSVTKT